MKLVATCLIALVVVVATPRPALGIGSYDIKAIDDFLQSEMSALGIPGLAVAVIDGDQTVHLRGFGVAGPGNRPVTPQTPFVLASTSKAFTALAAMQLVESGKLDLDTSVRSYLPWFTTAEPDVAGTITVRELLNQTSGFSTLTGNAQNENDDTAPGALERAVRSLSGETLVSKPGAAFHYSNTNYRVLGLLIQVASGEDYGTYMRDHVFAPLDMRHTHTSMFEARNDGLAAGYYRWFGLVSAPTDFPYSPANVPAQGIMSSVEDMSHTVIAHLNHGSYSGHRLLSPDGVDSLHRGVPAAGGYSTKYAMGWYEHPLYADPELTSERTGYRLPLVLDHGGTASNYHSVVMMLPALRRGAVLLMNAYENTIEGRFGRLQYGLELLLAGLPPLPANAIPDALLAKFGRHLLALALTLQLAWMVAWTVNGRRRPTPPASLLRRRILGGMTVAGLVLELLLLAWLWFIMPGQFDNTVWVLTRSAPDTGLMVVALTILVLGWTVVRVRAALANAMHRTQGR